MIDEVKTQSFGVLGIDNAMHDLLDEIGFLGIFPAMAGARDPGKSFLC
ncbi:MAG: hypothetical protein HQL69_22145 [Magnetococcales bacterium]|nr:hypothetical protein [Magnetococcales bacterium]